MPAGISYWISSAGAAVSGAPVAPPCETEDTEEASDGRERAELSDAEDGEAEAAPAGAVGAGPGTAGATAATGGMERLPRVTPARSGPCGSAAAASPVVLAAGWTVETEGGLAGRAVRNHAAVKRRSRTARREMPIFMLVGRMEKNWRRDGTGAS